MISFVNTSDVLFVDFAATDDVVWILLLLPSFFLFCFFDDDVDLPALVLRLLMLLFTEVLPLEIPCEPSRLSSRF